MSARGILIEGEGGNPIRVILDEKKSSLRPSMGWIVQKYANCGCLSDILPDLRWFHSAVQFYLFFFE